MLGAVPGTSISRARPSPDRRQVADQGQFGDSQVAVGARRRRHDPGRARDRLVPAPSTTAARSSGPTVFWPLITGLTTTTQQDGANTQPRITAPSASRRRPLRIASPMPPPGRRGGPSGDSATWKGRYRLPDEVAISEAPERIERWWSPRTVWSSCQGIGDHRFLLQAAFAAARADAVESPKPIVEPRTPRRPRPGSPGGPQQARPVPLAEEQQYRQC